jgi:hypothetical protein
MVHAGLALKHDWPLLAIGGVAAAVWYVANSGAGAKATGPSTLWPRTVGGQMGTPQKSSARSSDAGSVSAQVISAILGEKTALAESKDQLTLGEDQLTEQQNVAYRQSNVQAQESLNSEVPPPNGWTSILQSLIGGAASFFGGPVGAGVLGVTPNFGAGGTGFGTGYGTSYGYPGGGYASPYGAPPSPFSSPYGGGYGSGPGAAFLAWLYSLFSGSSSNTEPAGPQPSSYAAMYGW